MRLILKHLAISESIKSRCPTIKRLDSEWYPELVFKTVVFSNSIVSAVLIPNTCVFDTLFTLLLKFSYRSMDKLHVLSA